MMTVTQATQTIQRLGAAFVSQKDGVNWYREPSGTWVAWKALNNGMVELRRLPANSCGC